MKIPPLPLSPHLTLLRSVMMGSESGWLIFLPIPHGTALPRFSTDPHAHRPWRFPSSFFSTSYQHLVLHRLMGSTHVFIPWFCYTSNDHLAMSFMLFLLLSCGSERVSQSKKGQGQEIWLRVKIEGRPKTIQNKTKYRVKVQEDKLLITRRRERI
jgi:hypothetical protein